MTSGMSIRIHHIVLTLGDPALFVRKTITVAVAAFLLLPLTQLRSQVPVLLYVGSLLALHVVVLGVYFYGTRVRSLDADRRSLFVRLIAVAFIAYLLHLVSGFDADTSAALLVTQVGAAITLHTALLALVMVRMDFPSAQADDTRLAERLRRLQDRRAA